MLESDLNSFADQPTWNPLRFDPTNQFLNGNYIVALDSASFGMDLSQILYMFGTKLSSATIQKVNSTLQKRLIQPIMNSIYGIKVNNNIDNSFWWRTANTNWNSVCWAFSVC